MSERLWYWIAHVTCPDVYAPAPLIVRRVRWWWMRWWGWTFFYSDPWRPGRLSKQAATNDGEATQPDGEKVA